MAENPLNKLRDAIAGVAADPSSWEIDAYLPAFKEYASAIFDEQAATINAPTVQDYGSKLELLIQPIIEDILPDRGREVALELAIQQDGPPEHLPGELTLRSGLDGSHWRALKIRVMPSPWTVRDWWADDHLRFPASAYQLAIYGRYGVWEREVPGLAGHCVRAGLPGARPLSESLDQELRQRLFSWVGRFRQPKPQLPPGKVLASNLDRLRRECRWTWENLADEAKLHRSTVFDHLSGGVFPRKNALQSYASTFSRFLGRPILSDDLLKEAASETPAIAEVAEHNKTAA